MRTLSTIVSRNELLSALVLVEHDAIQADRLAKVLGFYPQDDEEVIKEILLAPPKNKTTPPSQPEQPLPQVTNNAPLKCSFLTVTACEPLESTAHTTKLPVAKKVLAKKDCQPLAAGSPPMPLLVRKQRLWPAVKRSLVAQRSSGIDIKRLTAEIVHAKPIARLPTLWGHCWGGELVVIWDRSELMAPYEQDYRNLLKQIIESRGYSGLQVYQVSGVPEQVTGCWPAKTADRADRLAIPLVAKDTKILILSDLGALSPSASTARHWQTFARRYKKTGVQLVAWVPHSARQVERDTAKCINIYCLDRQGNLRQQVGHLQTAAQRQAEHQRLHQLREQLLTRLAFCMRLEKELLRVARALHPVTALEPALEGLIWSYQPVVRASDISRPLAPDYQAHYRAMFSKLNSFEQQAALNCVLDIHRWQGQSTGVLETLIWESHVGNHVSDDAVKTVVNNAKAWISAFRVTQQVEDGSREAILFAEDLLSRNWQDAIFQRHHSEWLAELWKLTGQSEVPPGLDATDIAKLQQNSNDDMQHTYQLMTIGSQLMLWPVAMPAPTFAVSAINSPWTLEGLELISESPQSRHWLIPKGQPMQLLERTDVESCVLIAGGRRYSMTQLRRPSWASKFGRDRLGIFAEMLLSTEQGKANQTFRWIEPGNFLMGSPEDEPERRDNEGPQHEVTITQGFWLADTACTQALWQAIMDNNPSRFKDDLQLPVEQVSWHDVQAFLQRLQELLPGCQVDLPTEAEWEYACRAGTTTPFSFGDNINPQQVNYEGNFSYRDGEKGEYREKTLPVKSLPANAWGLYEMHGNVYEWCKDGQRTYDEQAQIDPLGPMTGDENPRCLRGGSWDLSARWARSAYRYALRPDFASSHVGFRFCLRSIESGQVTGSPAGKPGRATGGSPDAGRKPIKSNENTLISKIGSIFKSNPKHRS